MAVVSNLLNAGVWAYVLKRRLDRKETTTVTKEWQEYARRLRIDLERKDERIESLEERSLKCEDRERRLRNRVSALEERLGVEPPENEEDSDPKVNKP